MQQRWLQSTLEEKMLDNTYDIMQQRWLQSTPEEKMLDYTDISTKMASNHR